MATFPNSRWRLEQVDSCGSYARHLGFVDDSSSLCRFCNQAKESTFHLCTACIPLHTYRWTHNISLDTLLYDSPTNILAIADFDNYISRALPYAQEPPIQQSLQAILRSAKHKIDPDDSSGSSPPEPSTKRYRQSRSRKRHLVIPLATVSNTNDVPNKKRK